MKTLTTITAFLMLLTTAVIFAQDAATAPVAAKVQIDDTGFDFGYIPAGAVVSHAYTLHSRGADSLKILSVRPGCGCTKAPLKKEVVAAGDSTSVELVYTSNKAASGNFAKSATVTTNDTDRGNFQLTFKGKAYANPDSLTPLTLSLGEIALTAQTRTQETKLTVKNVSAAPIRLSLVSDAGEYFAVGLPDAEIKPGQSKEIKVKLNSTLPEDQFQKSFTFAVNDKDGTRYTIPVSLNKPAVAVH